jgi:protoheme IX farnesyltransferase
MNRTEENIVSDLSISATIAEYYKLTKPGIALSISISMLIGFVLGSGSSIDFVLMLHALIGTYLIVSGTSAHNQFIERDLDGLMKRTMLRPLPKKSISARNGMIFSLTLIFSGLSYLVLIVNPVAGLVSFATALIYLAMYTPLKRVSAFNILVGAIPGALPPVGGWAAASGTIAEPGMWILFGIVMLWQIPHVMAIAWMYKEDYAGAGFKMLPKNDSSGFKTSIYAIVCTVLLFPVSYALIYTQLASLLFLVVSFILAALFLAFGINFFRERSRQNARKLMFASIAYLPLVWLALFADFLLF